MVPILHMKPAQLVDFSSPMNIAWDGTWHDDLMAAWSLAGRETMVTPYNHINPDCPFRQRSIVWLYHWKSLSATASETLHMWRCEASHQATQPCGLRRPLELHVANSKRVSLMFLFMTLHTERCNHAAKKKKKALENPKQLAYNKQDGQEKLWWKSEKKFFPIQHGSPEKIGFFLFSGRNPLRG